MQRSEQDALSLTLLLQCLVVHNDLPTEREMSTVEQLLETIEEMPLLEEELRALWKGARDFMRRYDAAKFHREVGVRVARFREQAGFTLVEAADEVKLSVGELRLVESGQRELFLYEAARLADLYATSVDSLSPPIDTED